MATERLGLWCALLKNREYSDRYLFHLIILRLNSKPSPTISIKSYPILHNKYLQPIITQYFASNKSEIWP